LIQLGLDVAYVARQQFIDPFDWMIGNPANHLAQIILWIEAVQRGGLNQRVCRGRQEPYTP
jgi:hypothetical protein